MFAVGSVRLGGLGQHEVGIRHSHLYVFSMAPKSRKMERKRVEICELHSSMYIYRCWRSDRVDLRSMNISALFTRELTRPS
jgi:hypothetical protein